MKKKLALLLATITLFIGTFHVMPISANGVISVPITHNYTTFENKTTFQEETASAHLEKPNEYDKFIKLTNDNKSYEVSSFTVKRIPKQTQLLQYTVNYYKDEINKENKLNSETFNTTLGASITLNQAVLDKYRPNSTDPVYKPGKQVDGTTVITQDNQVINVLYTKSNKYKVTVLYWELDSDLILDTKTFYAYSDSTITAADYINNTNIPARYGYQYASQNSIIVQENDNNKIILYYRSTIEVSAPNDKTDSNFILVNNSYDQDPVLYMNDNKGTIETYKVNPNQKLVFSPDYDYTITVNYVQTDKPVPPVKTSDNSNFALVVFLSALSGGALLYLLRKKII